jgi:ElaB/YqjD/DUF883 family membrane-anchored ribosome-binding protein
MTVESSPLPFDASRPVSELSMVEVAEQLDQISAWMDIERQREQEAKQAYEAVARDAESRLRAIRTYGEKLLEQHRRRMSAFDGLLGKTAGSSGRNPLARSASFARSAPAPTGKEPKNLAEAIVSIWTLDRYTEPMTTEEIAEALSDVGYESDAAATSLRSSINQALAKLAKVGRMVKFRADGSQISPKDHSSRARKYLAAIRLPEPV